MKNYLQHQAILVSFHGYVFLILSKQAHYYYIIVLKTTGRWKEQSN